MECAFSGRRATVLASEATLAQIRAAIPYVSITEDFNLKLL